MKLIACGDSWVWGAELVDPIEEPIPLFKIGGDQHWREHKPINVEYRNKNRYIKLFADKIGATELVDLSQPSISNGSIYKRLLEYLAEQGYLEGKDTSDLFVSIGWTSPERIEFFFRNPDNEYLQTVYFGPWAFDNDDKDPDINKFLKSYALFFCHEREFMNRYIREVWQTQTLLKQYNIKYVMHQAFYHFLDIWFTQWDDKSYREKSMGVISPGDRKLWDNVDSIRFMHKNENTQSAHNYMREKAEHELGDSSKAFIVMHPSEYGHKVWAEHMYDYCMEHNLL